MSKYPQIVRIDSRKKNTQAKCKCGEVGTAKVHVEWTHMRGDDDVQWACSKHKLDINYLATGQY